VADAATLEQLYQQSDFTYTTEVPYLRRTYGKYLDSATRYAPGHAALLEIGCGNGFFLEEALLRGWKTVRGVEPGKAAAAGATESVRPHIACEMMRAGLFPDASFDVVCMFQVFDHFPDPAAVVRTCFEVLRPGGVVLAINHNVEAVSARLLGERSPIFDIEHTFLWSPATMAQIFAQAGFIPVQAGTVFNRFPLEYLARLAPLPGGLKRLVLACLEATRLARLPLSLPLGNLFFVARKPGATA
jgi:SAM-dependent methyltransferase